MMSPTLIGKFQYFLEKKDDGNTDPSIKSWSQPVGSLKDIPTNICNLRMALVLCPYRWTKVLKEFSSGSAHKEWKDYQGIIHNTYHGGNVETDYHVILLIT